jgi:hypothetical protein
VDAGDRLTIGPIEFEILESGAIPTSGTSRDRALSAKFSRGVGNGDSLVEHPQPAKDLTRKRTVKILRRLRHSNRRIADLTKELEKHNFTGEFNTSAERGARRCRVEQDGLRTEQSLLEEAQTLLRERQADLEAASERWKGEQERSEVESQARGGELERRADKTESAELDSLREALGKEREAIEAERVRYEQLAADIAEQRAELERQLGTAAREAAELQVERESFAEEQQRWEVAQLDARKQIEQRAEQLDHQKESLEEQKQALATAQKNWEALKAEAESKLAARAEQLDARERELDDRTAEVERFPYSANSTFEPSASGKLEFLDGVQDTDEPARSMNSLDLFREMRTFPAATLPLSEFSELRKPFRDDDSAPECADSEPAIVMGEEEDHVGPTVSEILLADPVIADSFVRLPSEERFVPRRPANRSVGEGDEDESIEQYMAGLLARVNNSSVASSAPPRVEPIARAPIREGKAPLRRQADPKDSGSCDGAAKASRSHSIADEPGNPRARAPEKAEDLVTLRELANLSAHSALNAHARSRLMKSVHAKLAVVTVALGTAGILFYRWGVSPGDNTYYYVGLAVVLIAIVWGVQYAALASYAYLTRGRRTSGGKESGELEDEDP